VPAGFQGGVPRSQPCKAAPLQEGADDGRAGVLETIAESCALTTGSQLSGS
jgi:hypothetical protein